MSRFVVIEEETYPVATVEEIEVAQDALRAAGLDYADVWEGDPENPGDDVKIGTRIFAE